jgi:hypothetical protein
MHKAEGWEKLGYYRYVIRIDKMPKETRKIRTDVGNLLTW